jgi:hypothetical protein
MIHDTGSLGVYKTPASVLVSPSRTTCVAAVFAYSEQPTVSRHANAILVLMIIPLLKQPWRHAIQPTGLGRQDRASAGNWPIAGSPRARAHSDLRPLSPPPFSAERQISM